MSWPLSSKWAMDDADYADKYGRAYPEGERYRRMAKQMIDAGEIGEPGMVRMKMVSSPRGGWDMPVASYDWRFDEYSEGRFSERARTSPSASSVVVEVPHCKVKR